jgi:hypothetical protein
MKNNQRVRKNPPGTSCAIETSKQKTQLPTNAKQESGQAVVKITNRRTDLFENQGAKGAGERIQELNHGGS